jgi:hypothetical protein
MNGVARAVAWVVLWSLAGSWPSVQVPAVAAAAGPVRTSPDGTPPTTVPGQRAAAEREVDLVRASLADVQAQIASVDAQLAEESRRLELTRIAVDVSLQRAAAAAARADDARRAAQRARAAARGYAVQAFIRPPVQDSLAVLSLSSARDAAYGSRVLRTVADRRREVLDRMTRAEAAAAAERAAADAAAATAESQAHQIDARVRDLTAAQVRQQRLAAGLDDRLDHALSEAAILREIDLRAARELADRELALRRSAPPTPTRSTAPAGPAAPARPPATPAVSPAGSGSPARPTTAGPNTPPPPPPGSGVVTRDQVVSVQGILVHRSIAAQVQGLLDAAAAAGIRLSGSGWRDTSRQIQLRMQHCGTTPYAIYEMPADQCIPPVARPGRSMHERGLAIDFTVGGDLIRSRSHPAYVWLAANAARFGLFNLPSEPWHWSVNGT